MADIEGYILPLDPYVPGRLVLGFGDRPAWCLESNRGGSKAAWIPASLETALSDGLLMWMLMVAKVPAIVDAARSLAFPRSRKHLELMSVDPKLLEAMNVACREADTAGCPLIVSAPHSLLEGQLGLVERFRAPMSVARMTFSRFDDPWGRLTARDEGSVTR